VVAGVADRRRVFPRNGAGGRGAWAALAFGADKLSDDGMRTLMYLDVGAYQVPGFGLGLFVGAASLVIATTGALPR